MPHLSLIGGKGGVGKTTCAAARAIALAAAGARTLLLSTDPAPSLGDALGVRLSAAPRRIPFGRRSLHAAEIDAPLAMRRWLRARRPTLGEIAQRGTWLDAADISSLLDQSLPGVDELAALLELLRFAHTGSYDAIVVDAAPTGHTLRMLALPETLAGIARVFDHMQAKHRAMFEALRGAWRPDGADALIEELESDALEIERLLRDPARAGVSWVTMAEGLAIEETLDAIAQLVGAGIQVEQVIVNRITGAPPEPCTWCAVRQRLDAMLVLSLRRRLRAYAADRGVPIHVTAIHARDREPVGIRALGSIAEELARGVVIRGVHPGRIGRVRARVPRVRAMPGSEVMAQGVRLAIFGGKGGVGKTTCAAAVALDRARRERGSRILLLSTDPAHSLGDVLDAKLGDTPASLPRGPLNLEVRELDPSRALQSFREQYAASVDAMFDRVSRGSFDLSYDRRVMHDLLDLAPPGLDEIAAIVEVVPLIDAPRGTRPYDLIVMDTAPAGHALRLLQMPAVLQDWVRALMAIVLKYQPVAGVGQMGVGLLRISKGIGRLRRILEDPLLTSFAVVTRSAALSRHETDRLLKTLRSLRIGVSAMIVNEVGAGDCSRCRRSAIQEQRELQRLRRLAAARRVRRVIVAPALLPPPAGVRDLARWRAEWVRLPAISSSS